MARLVMKFGGTSVGDIERIERVARLVAAEARAGAAVAVVVSAMSGETNRLLGLAQAAFDASPIAAEAWAEFDAVAAAGEQVSAGLLALVLQRMGLRARSWLGWQAGVATDAAYGRARISRIDAAAMGAAIDQGEIAVAAGFQGLSPDGRIATLGRGGSDTSAVAFAAALGAESCDIYTDVDGVYTTDPRVAKRARRLERISYEEMLEMASLGAKVLQTRSVELAMARGQRLRVASSFAEPGEGGAGTIVCDEAEIVEKQVVSGIAFSREEARISLLGVRDDPGVAARLFGLLADADINVDMIVQSSSRAAHAANMVFTLPRKDLAAAKAALEGAQSELGFTDISVDADVAKVSVIGVGMKSHVGVAKTMFETLAAKGINIEVISTSEIKISVLIRSEYAELAVRALHTAYGLDAEDS